LYNVIISGLLKNNPCDYRAENYRQGLLKSHKAIKATVTAILSAGGAFLKSQGGPSCCNCSCSVLAAHSEITRWSRLLQMLVLSAGGAL
jgi:hypothetical protein